MFYLLLGVEMVSQKGWQCMGNWGKINGKRVNEERRSSSRRSDPSPSMPNNEIDFDDGYDDSSSGPQNNLECLMREYVEAFDNNDGPVIKTKLNDFLSNVPNWMAYLEKKRELDGDTLFLTGRVFLVSCALNCLQNEVRLTSRFDDNQMLARAAFGFFWLAMFKGGDDEEIHEQFAHGAELFQSEEDFSTVFDDVVHRIKDGIDRDPDFARHFLSSVL